MRGQEANKVIILLNGFVRKFSLNRQDTPRKIQVPKHMKKKTKCGNYINVAYVLRIFLLFSSTCIILSRTTNEENFSFLYYFVFC